MPWWLGGGGVKTTENKIHWPGRAEVLLCMRNKANFLRFKPRFISWKRNTEIVFGKMCVSTVENPPSALLICTRTSIAGKSASFVVQTFRRSQSSVEESYL
jgi:hypothetical protein